LAIVYRLADVRLFTFVSKIGGIMINPVLVTESFSNGKKHYFLDFRKAVNDTKYITITRSDQVAEGIYKRSEVVVFEEDFEFLIQAFSSLFLSAAYYEDAQERKGAPSVAARQGSGIKSWPPEQRPREKLLGQGKSALSDAELLAILIGSGTPGESAVGLAGRILASVDHDLKRLAALSAKELCRFKGMGLAKSVSIIAAMELQDRSIRVLKSLRLLRA
jgi:hypothetical protein